MYLYDIIKKYGNDLKLVADTHIYKHTNISMETYERCAHMYAALLDNHVITYDFYYHAMNKLGNMTIIYNSEYIPIQDESLDLSLAELINIGALDFNLLIAEL